MGQETGSAKLHLDKTSTRDEAWWNEPSPRATFLNRRGHAVQEYVTAYMAEKFKAAGDRGFTDRDIFQRGFVPTVSTAMRRTGLETLESLGVVQLVLSGSTPRGGRSRKAWVWVGP